MIDIYKIERDEQGVLWYEGNELTHKDLSIATNYHHLPDAKFTFQSGYADGSNKTLSGGIETTPADVGVFTGNLRSQFVGLKRNDIITTSESEKHKIKK